MSARANAKSQKILSLSDASSHVISCNFFFLNAEITNSQNLPWCGYVCVRSGRGLFSWSLQEYSVELLINSSQEVRGMYYSYHSSSYAFACPHNWGRGISFDAAFVLGIAHRVDHRLTPSVLEK